METLKENTHSNKSTFSKWHSNRSVRTKIIALLKEKLRNNDKTPTVILVSGVRLGGKSLFINELTGDIIQNCLTSLILSNMSELSVLLKDNTDIHDQGLVFIAEEDTVKSTHDDQFVEVDYYLDERGIEDVLCVVVEPSPIIIVHNLRKIKKQMGGKPMTYIWENVALLDHHFCKAAMSTFFDVVIKRTMKRYKRAVKSGRVSVICRNGILLSEDHFDNHNKLK